MVGGGAQEGAGLSEGSTDKTQNSSEIPDNRADWACKNARRQVDTRAVRGGNGVRAARLGKKECHADRRDGAAKDSEIHEGSNASRRVETKLETVEKGKEGRCRTWADLQRKAMEEARQKEKG